MMDLAVYVFLPIAVGTIMLSLGLNLTLRDFTAIARWPKAFFVGLVCQIVLFPAIAFGIVKAFGISGAIAVGVMLLASCPGGNISSLFTKFVRGNVALSVSLTAVSSLLCMITLPIILKLSEQHFLQSTAVFLDLSNIAFRAFLLTTLPVTVGMLVRQMTPTFADKMSRILTKVAVILLVVIIVGAVAGNWVAFVENLWLLGTSMTCLFFLLTIVSFAIPHFLGLPLDDTKAISIEAGVQNGALGITVAALLTQGTLGFNDYSLASAIYGVLVYFTITPVILCYRHMNFALNQEAT